MAPADGRQHRAGRVTGKGSAQIRAESYRGGMATKKRQDPREPESDRVNVKVDPDLVRRIDALTRKASSLPELSIMGTIDRSKVARLAIKRGVEALEREAAKADGDRAR